MLNPRDLFGISIMGAAVVAPKSDVTAAKADK